MFARAVVTLEFETVESILSTKCGALAGSLQAPAANSNRNRSFARNRASREDLQTGGFDVHAFGSRQAVSEEIMLEPDTSNLLSIS